MIYCIILQHRSFGKWSLFVHGPFDLSVYIRITENSLKCMNACDIEQKMYMAYHKAPFLANCLIIRFNNAFTY